MRKLIWLIWITSLSSCIRDTDLDLNFQEKTVVYGIISPGVDPEIFVYTSIPFNAPEDQQVNFVRDARVYIETDGQRYELTGYAHYTDNFFNGLYNPDFGYDSVLVYSYTAKVDLLPEKTYTLRVETPLGEVTATTTIPQRVNLDDVLLEREEKVSSNGQPYFEDRLQLQFHDPKSIRNYYKYSVQYNQMVIIPKEEIDTTTGLPIVVLDTNLLKYRYLHRTYIDDNDWDGLSQTFSFLISDKVNLFNNPDYVFYVRTALRNYHPDVIAYKNAVDEEGNEDSFTDPFTEPMPIKSNIQGGLGIFSSYCESEPVFISYDP
ncbi:MAG: DUF4249 domain-containing protein [Chitinophagales bacterium]|nr:DUF4249 domain-containing protein [Chitinophagales bacterium]